MRQNFFANFGILAVVLVCSDAAANSLGEGNSFGWQPNYFGQNAQVSDVGEIQFDWVDPASNDRKVVYLRQRNVIGVPNEVRQAVAGGQISCFVVLETDLEVYADCGVFLEGWSGGRTDLMSLISDSDEKLIDCSLTERRAFALAGLPECRP